MATSLLISETPHHVIPSLAKEIGLNEALFLQQLHWRLQNYECYYYEKRLWWYHTQVQWIDVFPYWSESTIKKIIKSLRNKKLVTVKKFHKQILRTKAKSTNWYSINYEEIDKISNKVAVENHKKLLEKQNNRPIKIKGKDLAQNIPESATSHEESPLGYFDTSNRLEINQYSGLNATNLLNKINKEDLRSSSKRDTAPTEPEFNFEQYDLILAYIFNTLKNENFEFRVRDEMTINLKLGQYLKYRSDGKLPIDEAGAIDFVLKGFNMINGSSRRTAQISAASDNKASSVAKNLNTQAESIDRKTSLIEPKKGLTFEEKINDCSWCEDLDIDF